MAERQWPIHEFMAEAGNEVLNRGLRDSKFCLETAVLHKFYMPFHFTFTLALTNFLFFAYLVLCLSSLCS